MSQAWWFQISKKRGHSVGNIGYGQLKEKEVEEEEEEEGKKIKEEITGNQMTFEVNNDLICILQF